MSLMATSQTLNAENAALFLENMLLRERLDLKAWDTRQMAKNMLTMKAIVDKARWGEKEKKAIANLERVIDELSVIIKNKDATLVDAAHTHMESAVAELRKLVFGF
jgi:regulator of replication initiation timing